MDIDTGLVAGHAAGHAAVDAVLDRLAAPAGQGLGIFPADADEREAMRARARVEMKAIETVLHLRRQYPQRVKNMVPAHVWALVKHYGIEIGRDEQP